MLTPATTEHPKSKLPHKSQRITINLDRKAAKLIKHLQRYYDTSTAEFLRRALDAAHTKLYNYDTFVAARHVSASTEEPLLINFYLPVLLLNNSTYQARKLEISFPEYVRRAVIEYAVPTIRSMYPGSDVCRAS